MIFGLLKRWLIKERMAFLQDRNDSDLDPFKKIKNGKGLLVS